MKPKLPRSFPATLQQVGGPYFLPNSPFNNDFRPGALMGGEAFTFSGQVLSTDGKVIPGAVVHIWLADPNGRYDNQRDDGSPDKRMDPSKHRLRGRIKTGSDGSYSFSALRPGNYLNGDEYRPRHIHAKVEAPGYQTLITQLYFCDDPYNERDVADQDHPGEPGEMFFKPDLLVHLQPAVANPGIVQQGIFNFVLRR